MKTTKKPLSLFLAMLLLITTILTLSACDNNPETCRHDWGTPTCLEPAQCHKCDTYKADGGLGNHNYQLATCREPAKCIYCNQYKNDNLGTHQFSEETGYCYYCGLPRNPCANGHTEGDWVATKKATLTNKGTEELFCKVCNELLDSRTIQKKLPQVVDDYFNFTDDELIDWLNDISTANIYHTDLGIFGKDSSNTSYKIVMSDGETGALLLNHGDNGKNGNVQAIMVYFDNTTTADAMATYIGGKIDTTFDPYDAAYNLVSDKSYTAANMTVFELELDDDFIVTVLAPAKYVEDLLG